MIPFSFTYSNPMLPWCPEEKWCQNGHHCILWAQGWGTMDKAQVPPMAFPAILLAKDAHAEPPGYGEVWWNSTIGYDGKIYHSLLLLNPDLSLNCPPSIQFHTPGLSPWLSLVPKKQLHQPVESHQGADARTDQHWPSVCAVVSLLALQHFCNSGGLYWFDYTFDKYLYSNPGN